MKPKGFAVCLAIFASVLAAKTVADPIHDAAKSGDLAALERLVAGDAAIDSDGPLGTPLAVAVRAGQTEAVAYLLSRGADANRETILGTPIAMAARWDNLDIALLLLQGGANPNVGERSRPLPLAARNGNSGIVTLLLDHGADPEAKSDLEGVRALHEAAKHGHLDVVELLLKRGANPNTLTHRNEPALHFAVYHGHADIAELLRGITQVVLETEISEERLARADVERGAEDATYYCSICHPIGDSIGQTSLGGPHLSAVIGKQRGQVDPDFDYSEAFLAETGDWDIHSLNDFLFAPFLVVPGTKKTNFIPQNNERVRADIIAFLRTLNAP